MTRRREGWGANAVEFCECGAAINPLAYECSGCGRSLEDPENKTPKIIIDESVLSKDEWRILNAMSLREYKKNRESRGMYPLTEWQENQLILQRIYEAAMSMP